MEQLIIDAVANVGVPAVIALYVLARVNTTLDKLTDAVTDLGADVRLLWRSLMPQTQAPILKQHHQD